MQGSLILENLKLERVDEITGAVPLKEVRETINLLKTELRKNRDLTCLCAPQIGKNLRLFVVKTNSNTYKEFLNPMVVSKSKEQHLSRENNISVSKHDFIIPRNDEIHLAQAKRRIEKQDLALRIRQDSDLNIAELSQKYNISEYLIKKYTSILNNANNEKLIDIVNTLKDYKY